MLLSYNKMAITKHTMILLLYVLFYIAILPEKCSGYNNWEDYWKAYEQKSYYPRLYPYTDEFNDGTYETGDGFDAGINFKIPYFGRMYKGLYVSVEDGLVELSKVSPASPSTIGPKVKWPNTDYPNSADPPFLGPYYSTWFLSDDDELGNLYWRKLNLNDDNTDITSGMLDVISQTVREHVVGGDHFHATHGIIITWDNIYFLGCSVEPNCPRNTMQMVLVTDEVSSYAVYNYYNLTWVGSSRQSCDSSTGLRSDVATECFPAQAGFNVGEARFFQELPGSNQDEVVNLDVGGSTGIPGRFVYGLSGLTPTIGGCTNDTDVDPGYWRLEIYPKSVSMFGGEEVYFSGPCLFYDHDIKCKFGDQVVPGWKVPGSNSKGMCISPMMDRAGWTDFCVSLDDGNIFNHCTSVHIVPKYYLWPKVQLYNMNGEWYTRDKTTLMFKWYPESLTYFHEESCETQNVCNETSPIDLLVDINLLGYIEQPNVNGTMQGMWHHLHMFESAISNMGEYSFNTADHECIIDCGFEKPLIGIIQITVMIEDENPTKSIYSEAVPLGWYMNTALTGSHGHQWPNDKCIDWATQEKSDTSWMIEIEPCPTTKSQAYTDIGGYIYPNVPCDPEPAPCPMTPRPEPHIECAQSIALSSNKHGAVSTCCYPKDGHSSLIYGYDNYLGSTASKASPYASRDYYDVKLTPYMSHWARDRLPYIMCCNWTNDEQVCMETYMEARAINLDQYNPPKYAATYGDPHFFTFDGTQYMFNGHGEFWLLWINDMIEPDQKYENFNLQARFIQPPKTTDGVINATVISSVAMQEGDSKDQEVPEIEVQLNEADATTKLLILVNGAVKDFSSPELMYQEFYSNDMKRRTIVQNNDPMDNNQQCNFTIVFENGIAVQVANKDGILHVITAVPHKYFGTTEGLFGLWNDNPDDDLKTSGGQIVSPDESTEYLHYNFGITWEVGQTDSRFSYRGQANWDYYRDPNFIPNFEEPSGNVGNITDEEVNTFCGSNPICRFDYKTTMSKDVANSSIYYQLWMYEAQNSSNSVISCNYLSIPRSYRTVDTYLVGGHIALTGCWDGYTLLGETDYKCVQINEHEADWNPYIDSECKSDDEIAKEKEQLIASIVAPICVLIVIAAVAVGGFVVYKKRKSRQPQHNPSSGFSTSQPEKINRTQQFETMAENASRSQSLASSNVSFGSIVLTENIQRARPPRPTSQSRPNWQEQPVLPQNKQPPYQNSLHGSQGSQLDLRLQPYPNPPQGSQNDIRNVPPNQNLASQTDLRAQANPYHNRSYGSHSSQHDLRVQANPNTTHGSQNDVRNNPGFQSNLRVQTDPDPNRNYKSNSNLPGVQGHLNNTYGSKNDLRGAQGYPLSTQGQVNLSFNQAEHPMNTSRSSIHRGLPAVPPQLNGSHAGTANIAMADDDSDSSYEPRPESRANCSQNGNNTTGGFSKDTFV